MPEMKEDERIHEVSLTAWNTADARVWSQHVTKRVKTGASRATTSAKARPLTTTTEGPRHSTTTATDEDLKIARKIPLTLASCHCS